MQLVEVQLITENESSRVMICEDQNSAEHTRYSVFVTTDHDIIATLHRIYNAAKNISTDTAIHYFSDGGQFLVFYPYVPARPVSRFYMGVNMPVSQCELVCKNYIISCMTSELPYPILYLALKQGQANIARDGSIYLSYAFDLSEADESITETDCVRLLSQDLINMLDQKDARLNWELRELLKRKHERLAFSSFAQMYRDVDIASGRSTKGGFFRRLLLWFDDNKDRLFKVFLTICIILLVFTIITFLTNAIFGDVPWLRLFIRSFERIGEESLVQ